MHSPVISIFHQIGNAVAQVHHLDGWWLQLGTLTGSDTMRWDTATIFDQFEFYVVFRPDTGVAAENFYVSLGEGAWSWTATTTWDGTVWSNPNHSVSRPTFLPNSDRLPEWPNVYGP